MCKNVKKYICQNTEPLDLQDKPFGVFHWVRFDALSFDCSRHDGNNSNKHFTKCKGDTYSWFGDIDRESSFVVDVNDVDVQPSFSAGFFLLLDQEGVP